MVTESKLEGKPGGGRKQDDLD